MSEPLPRSPELMNADDTALLVVDVQAKLMPLILSQQRLIWNIRRLLDAAELLHVAVAATEQYPKGLGPTTPELAPRLGKIAEKLSFSCGGCGDIFRDWTLRDVHRVLVVGIETHVCVQQTVLDLLAFGMRVYLAVDALGARYEIDHVTALRRMESSGATLTTSESAIFEWCRTSGRPEFKQLSKLIQEPQPS